MYTSSDQSADNLAPRLPQLGEKAPAFESTTTQGPLRLSDLKGQWVILFSHPADFTPVCSTELMAFARLQGEFTRRKCRLVGLSVDSVYSHIAWVRDLERIGGFPVDFPIIADVDMHIARAYGMIHAGAGEAATVRSLFVIDPEGLLRAMLHYPPNVGRNVPEVLRLLEALQTADRENVATPADWQPGEPVLVSTPRTQEAAQRRLEEGYECEAWYLCHRPPDKS
ncbi:MAG TPA: peroxiredoxin [Armatimonadota bacterium]